MFLQGDLVGYQCREWREGAPGESPGRPPAHLLVEAARPVVLLEHAKPRCRPANRGETWEKFVMNGGCESGTPSTQGRTEVEKFVVANSRETLDLSLLPLYDERFDIWVREFLGPSSQHCSAREGVRILRKDVRKTNLGTGLLDIDKVRKVVNRSAAQKHALSMAHGKAGGRVLFPVTPPSSRTGPK